MRAHARPSISASIATRHGAKATPGCRSTACRCSNPSFFSKFGLYVERGFLDPDQCDRLVADAQAVTSKPATVREGNENVVDDDYRRTRIAQVSEGSVSLVGDKLEALRPTLENHFQVKTIGCRRSMGRS